MITAGLSNFRGSPVFLIYHQEVVTDISSFLQSLPRCEKICKRVLSPSHTPTAERQLLLAKQFNWYSVNAVSEWAILLLDLHLQ